MCSTLKGSDLKPRIAHIDYSKPDDSDYTNMLRRASQRYEAHQQVCGKREAEFNQRDDD